MLPASSDSRIRREVSKGKPSGRTSEIQRLIGRSLRAIIDFEKLVREQYILMLMYYKQTVVQEQHLLPVEW